MVAALGYEAYRRFFGSTSRDQKGELQLMVQVGPLAHALFAAKAGSAEQADYSLIGIAEQYEKQGKVSVPTGTSFSSCSESFTDAAVFSSGTGTVLVTLDNTIASGVEGGAVPTYLYSRQMCTKYHY